MDFDSCEATPGPETRRDDRRISWAEAVSLERLVKGRDCLSNACAMRAFGFLSRSSIDVLCCKSSDPDFAALARDLHLAIPLLRHVDGARNTPAIRHPSDAWLRPAGCAFEPDGSPSPAVLGELARAELYLWALGRLELDEDRAVAVHRQAQADPPSAQELKRDRRIAEEQGNRNPYVEYYAQQPAAGR